jgi:tetratricopeptide (TPR) repeat protein
VTRRRWALLIGLATAAVFARAAANGFVSFDDGLYITENTRVLAGLTRAGAQWAFTTFDAANWHPVTWLSHMLDVTLFGLDPAAHHAVGLLLHSLNAVLVFLLLDRMTGATGRAAAAAALFALHPLRVESVAWASERKDLLAALFGLLALLAYVRAARRRSGRALLASLALYAAGLMAKPTIVPLPLLLVLCDVWPLDRFREEAAAGRRPGGKRPPPVSRRGLLVEKLPFLCLAVASGVMTLLAQSAGRATEALRVPVSERLGNAMVSIVRYLGKTLLPIDLSVLYPHPLRFQPVPTAAAFVVIVAITAVCVFRRRAQPYLLFGWLWFLAAISPMLGLVQVGWQAMADRYTYLPSVGLSVLAVWAVGDLIAARPAWAKPAAAGFAIVLALLSALTFRQIAVWRDSLSLWGHALAVTQDNPTAELNFGGELVKAHRAGEAIAHLSKARRLDPDSPEAAFSLGAAYASVGKYEEARRAYEDVLRLSPDSAAAHQRIGELLAAQERWAEAVPHFEAQVRLEPSNPAAHHNLALALEGVGRLEDAIVEMTRAAALDPNASPPREELRRLLLRRAGGTPGRQKG